MRVVAQFSGDVAMLQSFATDHGVIVTCWSPGAAASDYIDTRGVLQIYARVFLGVTKEITNTAANVATAKLADAQQGRQG